MISQILTYHDLRAIPVIRNFVAGTGRLFGADDQEAGQLELAAEEAASFIINALAPDKDEPFVISAQPIDQGVLFCFCNKGLPVDDAHLPVFDSRDPSSTLEGLPFLILESITDAFSLTNAGHEGWILSFEKRFRRFRPLREEAEPDPDLIKACSREKLVVERARPQDAYSIIRLVYLTYRYSYIKSIFYDRSRLEQSLASEEVIGFVGRNSKGEIVVLSSYTRPNPDCAVAEAGVLMSHPLYRKNRALLRVARMQIRFLDEGQCGLRAAFTNLVTGHTKSQKLAGAFGFRPTAIIPSVHDRARFIGISTDSEQRESLLVALRLSAPLEPSTLLPASPSS